MKLRVHDDDRKWDMEHRAPSARNRAKYWRRAQSGRAHALERASAHWRTRSMYKSPRRAMSMYASVTASSFGANAPRAPPYVRSRAIDSMWTRHLRSWADPDNHPRRVSSSPARSNNTRGD